MKTIPFQLCHRGRLFNHTQQPHETLMWSYSCSDSFLPHLRIIALWFPLNKGGVSFWGKAKNTSNHLLRAQLWCLSPPHIHPYPPTIFGSLFLLSLDLCICAFCSSKNSVVSLTKSTNIKTNEYL